MLFDSTPSWLTNAFSLPGWNSAIDEWYTEELEKLPVHCKSITLKTHSGLTHLLQAGDPSAPPLVLLHGRAVNACVWRDFIADYARDHCVYALDVVGEGGKSDAPHPFTWSKGYAEWLVEVLDQLELEKIKLAGYSFGGWLSLKLAVHAPARIERMALLAPAGFVWASLPFVMRGIRAALRSDPRETREFVTFLSAPGIEISEPNVRLLHLVMHYHRTNPEPPPPFSDAHLRGLNIPTQLLIGAHDMAFDAQMVIERARRILPDLRDSAILPGIGHGILTDHREVVQTRLRMFLGDTTVTL
jgi:pimeloyl-ACP methyl ester carboxylesterase